METPLSFKVFFGFVFSFILVIFAVVILQYVALGVVGYKVVKTCDGRAGQCIGHFIKDVKEGMK